MQSLEEIGVESILDRVVSPSSELASNLRPLVTKLIVEFHNQNVLFHGPVSLLYARVQALVPSLPALLPNAPWKGLGDKHPVLQAILSYLFPQRVVLFLCPSAFPRQLVLTSGQLEVPPVALDQWLVYDLGYCVPRLAAEGVHKNE